MSAPSFQRICPVPCLSCHVTSCRWWLRRKELVMVNLCEENNSTFYAFIDGYVNLLFFLGCITCNCNCDRPLRRFLQSCLNKASKRAPRTRAQSNSPALEKAHDPPMACLSFKGPQNSRTSCTLACQVLRKKGIIYVILIRYDMAWYDIMRHHWTYNMTCESMSLWCRVCQHVRFNGHRTIDCWSRERMQNET